MKSPVQHEEGIERTEESTQNRTQGHQFPHWEHTAKAEVIQGKEQLRNPERNAEKEMEERKGNTGLKEGDAGKWLVLYQLETWLIEARGKSPQRGKQNLINEEKQKSAEALIHNCTSTS